MAGLSIPGVGSGFPVQQFIDATVQSERAPKENAINRKQSKIDVQISSYASLTKELDAFKKSLNGLTDKDAFQQRSVTLSNEGFLTSKADKNAVAGSYDIEVKALAKADKVGSGYLGKTVDISDNLGAGSLNLSLGAESFSVNVGAENSSLADIAKAINQSDDNTGVSATVVTDDNGSRLVLFGDKTGIDNKVTVSTGDSFGGIFNNALDNIQAASDAVVKIDGATVTRSSNEITDAIAGVTLNLEKINTTDDPTTTLKIGYDKKAVTENLKEFVDAYNKVVETSKKLSSYDSENDKAGPLNGDSLLRGISSQLRDAMGEQVTGASSALQSLSDLGITTTRDGTLEIDNDILDDNIANNFNGIGRLFDGDSGLANKLDSLLDDFVGRDGILTNKKESLDLQSGKYDQQRLDLDVRMEKFELRVAKQFNAMDAMVAEMNNQMSTMMSMLGTGGML
ncbi:flagellar filament capping protein FliD [Oceanisphaera pacifica]|uniref:Flagellar hook-associated protein 2 n=1 Tax=Oceanisphaera pacifica TaxID=2818389 RepID=A0ABS3NJH2_9GAMM|nr:flagellar filament capping protein FliD [Oceanisphaera pacifica]MBO1520739.1 flagellar filament capping protein FliD [Oceanisphaera pacifica]